MLTDEQRDELEDMVYEFGWDREKGEHDDARDTKDRIIAHVSRLLTEAKREAWDEGYEDCSEDIRLGAPVSQNPYAEDSQDGR